MDPSQTQSLGSVIQGGALLVFALAVLWELRQQRIERNQQTKMMSALLAELNAAMDVLLDRIGVERKRRATSPVKIQSPEETE